jgi:HSP20 family molecular chaperone IbpA
LRPRTETPKYEVAPFFAPDLLRTNLFGINPFTLARKLGDEMDRAFGKAVETAVWHPVIEVKRDKDKLLVHAELPGLKKENVKVTVTGDLLEIEGERKFETEEKHNGYFHSERNYGKFYRGIPLPEGANAGMAAAEFTDGWFRQVAVGVRGAGGGLSVGPLIKPIKTKKPTSLTTCSLPSPRKRKRPSPRDLLVPGSLNQ